MQALLDTAQESHKTKFTDSEDDDILSPEERAILEDSYDRPTSDELFFKVRQDAIDLLASKNSLNSR